MPNTEMPKAYDPKQTEERLYEWWKERGYFEPRLNPKRTPFTISIPPPNITGELHHGHAMFVAFEDFMIRWHRMLGDPTLWLPGTDHAGIATQNVVEKQLEKQGIKRREMGREEFVNNVWAWREEYGGIINMQIRRLGASCDWSRERFTLDEGLSRAVREAFVRLYEKKLIYRGPRLVNWCPRDESAISDLEVEHEDTQGKLYYVRYRLAPANEKSNLQSPISNIQYITVATTRPETILGDTAIAVNPADKRYKKLVGKIAILPALGRRIPIIADASVDPQFGTGAVKVTPGHDPTDYAIGSRHKLPIINIMNPNATINANGGPYAGLDRYEARKRLVEDLQRVGVLEKIQDHSMSIGRCQRCDAVIEPLISTQWFVKIKPLAKPAIAAVKTGQIKIVPERFNKIYFNWMTNIRDWCISRQLWWGHRIPVWYCDNGHETCARTDPTQCTVCGSKNIRQDEDVLDTWFSSGLWPFSTLGWPEQTLDLKTFYPTSVLETGYDILFFWVARMIMLGLECTGEVPFRTIYLHGLIRHKDGSKISKSNPQPGDNPLDVIKDYSSDSLRYTILTSSTPGNDTKLDLEKVESARNFGNKIWNIARFVISNLADDNSLPPIADQQALSLPDRWILSRLNQTITAADRNFAEWNFGEGTRRVYEFLWDELADWYIEASKIALNGGDAAARARTLAVLVHTLDQGMRLMHPAMPFVTEETWQQLRGQLPADVQTKMGEALMVAEWPRASKKFIDRRAEKDFGVIMEAIRAIRNARSEFHVEAVKRIPAIIVAGKLRALIESQREMIVMLARLQATEFVIETRAPAQPPAQSLSLIAGSLEIYLPLAGMMDLTKEKARLGGEIELTRGQIARARQLLASEYTNKAPKEVVQKTRDQLQANEDKVGKLDALLASLEGRVIAKPRNTKSAKKSKVAKAKRTKSIKITKAVKSRKRRKVK